MSRERYLNKFLSGKCPKGDIKDQALAIEILYSCAIGIHNYYNHIERTEKIVVRNKNTFPIKINTLKKYSNSENTNENKELLEYYKTENIDYRFTNVINYLKDKNLYEVFISVSDENEIAAGLLYKTIKNKSFAYIYYYLLKKIIDFHNIKLISKLLEY